jgi:hypothetical protein
MLKTSAKVNGNANSHLFFNSSAPLYFWNKTGCLIMVQISVFNSKHKKSLPVISQQSDFIYASKHEIINATTTIIFIFFNIRI